MELTIYVFSIFATSVIAFPSDNVKEFPQLIRECHPGEVIKNDCNKCICSRRKVFECIPKKCNIFEIETSCRPDTIYVTDAKTCICNRFGKWPHQDCSNIFQNLADTDHCEPNTYITVDCNVCRCGSNGKIDRDHCTKNYCQEIKKEARRHLGTGQVYGACDIKNWYSLAPCQFCYCVNENKLVCNTGNHNSEKLDLGSYKLNVCGKDLLSEAIELVPQGAKDELRQGNRIETTIEPTSISTTNPEIQSIIFGNDMKDQPVTPANEINYDVSNSESKSSESDEDRTSQIRVQEFTAKPGTVLLKIESEEKITERKKPEGKDTDDSTPEGKDTDDSKPEGKDSDDSNEIPVEMEDLKVKPIVMAINTVMKSETDSIQKLSEATYNKEHKPTSEKEGSKEAESKDVKFNLPSNLNLPGILNKVFEMALRKSMVSVVKDTKCMSGTTTAVKCNVCFCTNEEKMICTNTKCP